MVCSVVGLDCLILDQGRPARVGEQGGRFILLQRTRREHYNLVVCQAAGRTQAVFTRQELGQTTRDLWKLE